MKEIISKIRDRKPIVHCITNAVTTNDCANVLVAIGASPIMAHHIEEAAEITSGAAALVINLGATDDYRSIEASVAAANAGRLPVVMDPVGCGASTYRRNFALKLLERYHIDCLRGNYSEIVAILNATGTIAGLDNRMQAQDLPISEIWHYAREHQMLIFASGKKDYIFDGLSDSIQAPSAVQALSSGDEMLTTITGSGCMLSALAGAFLYAQNDADSLVKLCTIYGDCARKAAMKTRTCQGGSMTFRTYMIDELSLMRG